VRSRAALAATAFPAATEAACAILRGGGNAIDAAVAAAWALAVCEPSNSGLGGQTSLLIHLANGRTAVLDGHSRAPGGVSTDTVSRSQQRAGYRATTVPTTPLVLETAHQRYGRLPRAALLAPAIRLAEEGFSITPLQRRQVMWCLAALSRSTSASRLFLRDGRAPEVGEYFAQPALAATLCRLAESGAEDFYRGSMAREIAADMRRNGGLLTLHDLAGVDAPLERQPLVTTYRDGQVFSAPPPAGGWQVALGLRLLEQLEVDEPNCDPRRWYEMLGEATWAVFRERERNLVARSTPLTRETIDELLADKRIAELVRELDAQGRPSAGADLGEVAGAEQRPGAGAVEESGGTTHLCVVDSEGNIVSLTQSIQSLFGACVVCESLGFLYNNYLVTCPREPHAHRLAPGCLPRSNAAPTLLRFGLEANSPERTARTDRGLRCGRVIALGAGGSRRTTSALLHTISGVADCGLPLAPAVDAPRFHVKLSRRGWLERAPRTEPLVPFLERRFGPIRLRARHSYAMGCVQAVERDAEGRLGGTADPRREGRVMMT
jgi:gamma-glutamyltranspeptidase/glutathione hydrolase